jgi:hypothetical protein
MSGERKKSAIFLTNGNNTSLHPMGPVNPDFKVQLEAPARRVLFGAADVVGISMGSGYNFRITASGDEFRVEEAEIGMEFNGQYHRLAEVVERRVNRDGLIIIVS